MSGGADEIATKVRDAIEGARVQAAPKAKKRRRPRAGGTAFRVEGGFVQRQVQKEREDGSLAKVWEPVFTELHVVAFTRTEEGDDWGRLLRVIDRDGTAKEWAMPISLLAGENNALHAQLLSLGLEPAPGVPGRVWRSAVIDYLFAAEPEDRVRCVDSIGWHGRTFVLPDACIGGEGDSDDVILQSAGRLDHGYRTAGALRDWRREVGAKVAGNSRLVLAVSAAFAAPLVALSGDAGGGFHLRGGSSIGKSTALLVAGSVWGGGGLRGYVQAWRATDNALEARAELHNDALLCLDELAQIDPRAAAAAAYMLSNGMGKARAGREGHARRAASWRLLFLSTGEIALADKIAEGGARIAAGMEVRVVDLRADAGKGLGIFEDLHGAPDAATFAHDLKRAASSFYGTAARAFLEAITEDLDGVRENLAELRRAFIGAALGPGADGQVRRVADRFALVAAGGEIATRLGITGWPEGEAIEAALTCLRSWIAERGGTGSGEIAEAKRRLAEALELYGQSRFQKFHRNADRAVITPRWGFVRSVGDDGEELPAWEFFLHPAALREVLSGFDLRSVTDALVAEGIIVTEAPKHEKAPTRYVPNGGSRMRLYQIDAEALSGRGSGHADDA